MQEPIRYNPYDRTGSCAVEGKSAEERFIQYAQSKGWNAIRGTTQQNMFEHWDVMINKDDKSYRVDVKGKKRVNRNDTHTLDDKVWIELDGFKKIKSWLYGKADLIAFETTDKFTLIPRLKLIQLVDKLVDKTAYVQKAKDALYKVYARHYVMGTVSSIEESDKVTMIKLSDIEGAC